jgi:hypothetical protein
MLKMAKENHIKRFLNYILYGKEMLEGQKKYTVLTEGHTSGHCNNT